jgi:hypothetical protein|tara:strand:+ start:3058 stop:3183 length:126 start_codon:yes stop_codon:yes gene_type:complete
MILSVSYTVWFAKLMLKMPYFVIETGIYQKVFEFEADFKLA